MNYDIWGFILIGLAVWRISDMLSDTNQSGLYGTLDWLRSIVGVKYDANSIPFGKYGSIASGILCLLCCSVWLGFLFTILWCINQKLTILVSLPFALSAVAILIEDWRTNGR